jgi:CRISPR-associated endonuclease/helicase Cas3
MTVFAHSRLERPEAEWERLCDHAERVANRAEEFCASFALGYGRALGLLHDAGKYQPDFQAYLHKNSEAYDENGSGGRKAPHSIVGATWAWEHGGAAGRLLALPIAAHHGALKTRAELRGDMARAQPEKRLQNAIQGGFLPDAMRAALPRNLPMWADDLDACALGIRLLLSALTDADMLETEAWYKGRQRPSAYVSLETLLGALEAEIRRKHELDQSKAGRARDLAEVRAEVSQACLAAAELVPGRFRLTVPTGGGKTLSGLRFALQHAVLHGLSRVIVVIPYTSILEQTVNVYREIFDPVDPAAVIEHHSALDPANESQQHRLACENWDAPIVVTTSVQFFESLYAHHKRPCRKLHRIANSVVLLDEVQTFPLELLDPIQLALTNLAKHFGTTVVSMTATQPLLAENAKEREIVTDPPKLYSIMRERFDLEWMGSPETAVEWEAVAERARAQERVLVIVHRRNDSELLAKMLGTDCFHLSARMCAAHRLAVLEKIKERLKQLGPCRVVSTQLVEAGVDIDFPVVMRAFAGLETLAQAVGRCNREYGSVPGKFVVFRAPTDPPKGTPRTGLEAALHFYRQNRIDLNNPNLFPSYTARVLQTGTTDIHNILGSEQELSFPESARNFRMIDDAGYTVVVPWAEGWQRVQTLRAAGPSREGLRALQRFTVNIYKPELMRLLAGGLVERLFDARCDKDSEDPFDAIWMVRGDMMPNPYSERFGLSLTAMSAGDAELITPESPRRRMDGQDE